MSVLEFTMLTQALSRLEERPIVVSAEQCLNSRHKDADCHRCIDLCPKQAISQREYMEVDAERCVACGLCWRVCPTEVFTLKAVDDRNLLAQLCSLLSQGNRLEVACSRAVREGTIRSGSSGILELTCLGQLSSALLIGSIVAGAEAIWINDSLCPECALGSIYSTVKDTVATSRSLLGAFGREQSIFSYQDSAWLLPAKGASSAAVKVRAEQPLYSRRDLFHSLGSRVARGVTEMAFSVMEDFVSTPNAAKTLEQHLPARRLLLAQLLLKLGKPAKGSLNLDRLPMAQVKFSDHCSACGLCSKFCPTGALKSEASDDDIKFTFTTIYCIACGICRKVCPNDAIKLSCEISTARLIEQEPEVLMRCAAALCAVCGVPCASNGPQPLCFVCRKRVERQKTLSSSLLALRPRHEPLQFSPSCRR